MGNKYRSVLASGGGVQPTGNAQPADVLAGKTFSNADGIDKTGTMVNNGAVSETLTYGQTYTVPEGYHNGSGTVTAPSASVLHFTTPTNGTNPTTFTASDVVVNTEFYLINYDRGPDTYNNLVGLEYLRTEGSGYGSRYVFKVTATDISITFTRTNWQEYMTYGVCYLGNS